MTTYTTQWLVRLAELDNVQAWLEELYGMQDLQGHQMVTEESAESFRQFAGPALREFYDWRRRWDETPFTENIRIDPKHLPADSEATNE